MSRLLEWVDREEHILLSNIRECDSKISKHQTEINGLLSDLVCAKDDLEKLLKAKELLQKLEGIDDTTG